MTMTTKRNVPGRLLAATGVLALLACQPADRAGRTDTMAAGGDVAMPGTGATAATGATGATGALADLPQNDGDIVNVLMTIDRSEVEAARLAQERAQSQEVRAYASEMINQHSRHMRQTEQLAERERIEGVTRMEAGGTTADDTSARAGGADTGAARPSLEPEVSSVITQLRRQHEETMTRLRSASGAEFDSLYVSSQVAAHQQALDFVQRMQRNTQNEQLRQHLTETATVIERHHDLARELQQNLQSGAAGTGDTGAGRDTGTGRDTGSAQR